jgi:hypothetical protein
MVGGIVVGVSALLAIVLVSIALAWLFQRRLIYLADPGNVPPAACGARKLGFAP